MQADLLLLLERGGEVGVILIVLSVAALTLTLYKLWQFTFERVGRHRTALAAMAAWFDGERAQAYEMAAGHRAPLSRVLAHAMRGQSHAGISLETVKEDVTRVALEELHELRRYMRAIELIAQSAPLLGLLGTVLGMIEAFSQLEGSGIAVDPKMLAGGIWTALLTTALGLTIALVFSAAGAWFEARIENERTAMETAMIAFFSNRITETQGRGFDDVTTIGTTGRPHAH